MHFVATSLAGVFIIQPERLTDERGYFARTFCAREFAAHGLDPTVAQSNVSRTERRGTIRGLHYQVPPAQETKLVRCTRGAVYDVVVDLRPRSPTRGQHLALELVAEEGQALYVPGLCGHGFQTLLDDTVVEYQISEFYAPEYQRGLRYDDPVLGIRWPLPVAAISDRDKRWPLLAGAVSSAAMS